MLEHPCKDGSCDLSNKCPNLDDEVDLGAIAVFLHTVHPQYSACEFVKMLRRLVLIDSCTCSLCSPTKFPACLGCP